MDSSDTIRSALRLAAETQAVVTVGSRGDDWYIGQVLPSAATDIIYFELAPVHVNPLAREVILDVSKINFVGFNRTA